MNASLPVAILTGPTATGKTGIAIAFAREHGGIEIINADSMLVYQEMTIGTAKPSKEEMQGVPHHLIDVTPPNKPFTAGEFTRLTHQAIAEIHSRGKRALITGGTGFYLKALIFGQWDAPAANPALRATLEELPNADLYQKVSENDPVSAQRIGPNDRYRLVRALEIYAATGKTLEALDSEMPKIPDPRFHLLVIDRDTDELFQRIRLRTRQMLTAGLVKEVEALVKKYPNSRTLSAVGYEQTVQFLKGQPPQGRKMKPGTEGLQDEIELATRQLVKRQRTWFKSQDYAQNFVLPNDVENLLQTLLQLYPSQGS